MIWKPYFKFPRRGSSKGSLDGFRVLFGFAAVAEDAVVAAEDDADVALGVFEGNGFESLLDDVKMSSARGHFEVE